MSYNATRYLFVHIIMATFKLSLFIQKSGTINFNLVHFWRNRDLKKKFFSLVCCFCSRRYTFFFYSIWLCYKFICFWELCDGFCTTMTIYILCTTEKTLPGKSQRTRDEKTNPTNSIMSFNIYIVIFLRDILAYL